MMRNAVLSFAVAASLCACAGAPTASSRLDAHAAVLTPPAGYVLYAVRPGETLWRIARYRHIELEELVRLNKIADVKKIDAGQVLVVPQASESNFMSSRSEALDFVWPVEGKVIAYFKEKAHGVANKGIDIQARPGERIHAARSGRVAFIGKLPGYGTILVLDHEDGYVTVYGGARDIAVAMEETVAQGLVLAHAGGGARAQKGQVHFEIRRRHKPQNPLFFLD